MKTMPETIPQVTLETVARSFFKETVNYGFQQLDYVRFVNLLLDLSLESRQADPNVSNLKLAA